MNPVLKAALGEVRKPLGCIVHLGARNADLSGYRELQFERLVLINGDTQVCADLRREAAEEQDIEVLERVVAPAAGELQWHGYNLCAFSSTLEAGRLCQIYPRLVSLEHRRVMSTGIETVMLDLDVQQQLGRTNLLVLDLPGQEARLLNALPAGMLAPFQCVILLGAQEGLYLDADGAGCGTALLEDRHYVRSESTERAAGLWPLTLLLLDQTGHELQALTQRHEALQSELVQHRTQAEALIAEHEARAERLSAQLAELDAAAIQAALADARRTEQLEALGQAKAGLESDLILQRVSNKQLEASLQMHRQQIEDLKGEVEVKDQCLADVATTVEHLERTRDDLLARLAALQSVNADLQSTHAGLVAQLALLRDLVRPASAN